MLGAFAVPVVHVVYLIKSDYIKNLSYMDGTHEWEFIIFSRNARKNGIQQYICNEEDFENHDPPSSHRHPKRRNPIIPGNPKK